jgi:hypothetical protein
MRAGHSVVNLEIVAIKMVKQYVFALNTALTADQGPLEEDRARNKPRIGASNVQKRLSPAAPDDR